ncbi:MAG TPA: phosphoenolpyruvate--protein phosphotransferase [Elusimicrobia bacterium]|nr:phosphoenolpyruvate--protein phosphotransferase [Elusimicrobiota bacterium]
MSDPSAALSGRGVSPGVVQGIAFVVVADCYSTVPRRIIAESEVGAELEKFDAALQAAERDLLALRERVERRIGKQEAEIFAAQALVLKDPLLLKEVLHLVSHEKRNVEAALTDIIAKFAQVFSEIQDPYLQARASDIRDVGRRVLSILMKTQCGDTLSCPEGSIVVGEELLPSATAHMHLQNVAGFVTERGSKTSHASILARSMGVPLVVGVEGACSRIRTGDLLIVDGTTGKVVINPGPRLLREYDKRRAQGQAEHDVLEGLADLPSVTADGTPIRLCANVAKLDDLETVDHCKADGIGLLRTEFLFMAHDRFPTEEEQFAFYRTASERLNPREVTIRVLDLGGDKTLPYFPLPATLNPSLGHRGTRLLLNHPEILETQLRAILRASAFGKVRVLLPMVIGTEDVVAAKAVLGRAKEFLRYSGIRFDEAIRVGAMIEVPSAVIMVQRIAREVDFLSVGTNDLIQYLLTVDRTSPELAPYYDSLHPAVLETIRGLAAAAGEAGRELSLCGEMAADERYTPLLIGLGVRSFSVVPGRILRVRSSIRSTSVALSEKLAPRALKLASGQAVMKLLRAGSKG